MKKNKIITKLVSVLMSMTIMISSISILTVVEVSAISNDICVYSQWNCDVYSHVNGDGAPYHLCVSGCGWCALAHAIEVLGLERGDREESGYTPLPEVLYNKNKYDSTKGIGASSNPVKQLLATYEHLHAESASVSSLSEALSNGKVAPILYKWDGGGHFVLAAELSDDGQYVHIYDSCLNVVYGHFKDSVYVKNTNGSFTKINANETDFAQIAAKKVYYYCSNVSSGTMTKTSNGQYHYAGGDYWVKYSFANQFTKCCYLYSDIDTSIIETSYPTYVSLQTKDSAYLKALPCSEKSDSGSVNVINSAIPNGTKVTATKMVKNIYGNFWYEVSYSGKKGYIYSGNATYVSDNPGTSALLSNSLKTPSGTLTLGKTFSVLNGKVISHAKISLVRMYIKDKSNGNILYDFSESCSGTSYQTTSSMDNAMAFSKLPVGNYSFVVEVKIYPFYYNGSVLTGTEKTITAINSDFSISKDGSFQPTTEETVFNANKNAVNQLMIVSQSSTYYYSSPSLSSSPKTLTINSQSTNKASYGDILYADYYGTNTDGVAFYHLANFQKGVICDQTGGCYVLASDLMSLVDGTYHNATNTNLMVYKTAADSDTTYDFLIPSGSSFMFTGNISGNRHQVRYDGKTGWTRIGYGALDIEHNWSTWSVKTASTCSVTGTEQRTCSLCGKTETRNIAALGHSFVQNGVISPTCTKTGYTTYKCTRCNETKKENETSSLGHDYSLRVVNPTCVDEGYTEYSCSRCSNIYTDNQTAALGHSYTTKVTAPTCTAQGYTTHTCSRCSNSYKDTYVSATGHKYDNACDASCNVCGTTRSITHSYGAWSTVTEATCTAAGSEKRTCSVCNATETRAITVLGHNYTTKVTNPTCTDKGYTTYTCSECKDTYVDTYIDALGHKYGDWIVEKEASSTETGLKKKVCSVCSDVVSEVVEKLPAEPETRKYSIKITGSKYTVNGKTQRGMSTNEILSGDKVDLIFTGAEKFLYWVDNANNRVLSSSPEYEFNVTSSQTISAIYVDEEDVGDTEAYVIFTNGSGQMLSAGYFSDTEEIVFPAIPSKSGKKFVKWNKTEKEIKAAMATSAEIVVEPVFEAVGGTYTITVKYAFEDNLGTHNDDKYEGKNVGVSYRLQAPAIDGYEFAYWMRKGEIVSYANSFFMMGTEDLEITAMYTRNAVEKTAIAFMSNVEKEATADGKHKLKFTEIYSTPDNCTFVETGFIRSTIKENATVSMLTLENVDGSTIKKSTSSDKSGEGYYVLNLSMSDDNKVVYIRAYVTFVKDGVQYTNYSDIASASYNNLDYSGGGDEAEESGD